VKGEEGVDYCQGKEFEEEAQQSRIGLTSGFSQLGTRKERKWRRGM